MLNVYFSTISMLEQDTQTWGPRLGADICFYAEHLSNQ